MNLKTSLIPTLALMALNPIVSSLKAPTLKLTNDNNDINTIAAKYESSTIDVSTMTFDNYHTDIKASSINKDINKGVSTNFEIDKINTTGKFVWYNGVHGQDMRDAYNNKIEDDTVNLMYYLPMLSVISHVAHYYGDNASMNPQLRKAAITQDVGLLVAVENNIKTYLPSYAANKMGVFAQINKWATNYKQIINWVVAKDYDKCTLLSEFNKINYNSLTSSYNNLHAAEDFLAQFDNNTPTGSYVKADDFHLDTTDGHYFDITFSSPIFFGIRDFIFYQVWDFTFSDPFYFTIDLV